MKYIWDAKLIYIFKYLNLSSIKYSYLQITEVKKSKIRSNERERDRERERERERERFAKDTDDCISGFCVYEHTSVTPILTWMA